MNLEFQPLDTHSFFLEVKDVAVELAIEISLTCVLGLKSWKL